MELSAEGRASTENEGNAKGQKVVPGELLAPIPDAEKESREGGTQEEASRHHTTNMITVTSISYDSARNDNDNAYNTTVLKTLHL
jgi:hypothetical protein